MHKGLFSAFLLATTFSLPSCQSPNTDADTSAQTEQARWSQTTVRQLRESIAARVRHGLDHVAFAVEGDVDSADGQAALNRSALRFASALASGASDPAKLHPIYSLPRPKPDLEAGLRRALSDQKLDAWLESLAPQSADYKALSKAYSALAETKPRPVGPIVAAPAAPLKPGASDPRLPAIAKQLTALGYLDQVGEPADRYDAAKVQAVRHMQADYGFRPDGVIGKEALEILNLSDAARAAALAIAMERLRWLDRAPPPTRIEVDLAAAQLAYWRDGKVVDRRKVVVGDPETPTPQLGSPIVQLVANPTWTVPRSIERKELAGKGDAYLRRNNMAWKDGWIVQQPGPKNSLGLVKFDMRNPHAIYLHDTPAKALFAEVQRQRSHGCVRVDDALGFAEMLARDAGIVDLWNKARSSGKESYVKLPAAIPVHLIYRTVLFDKADNPVIRADPYGWDDRVAKALGLSALAGPRLRRSAADIGP